MARRDEPTQVQQAVAEGGGVSTSMALDALSDAELAHACVAGRPGAFDLLVTRHSRHIYQLSYRFLGNHEDATDLAQDVFLRAFRALPAFKGESSLGTWLYRIAVNLCLNKVGLKTPRHEPMPDADVLAAPMPDAVHELLRAERAEQVRAAIAKLPDRQRAALILRVYQDLPHQEIADILGSSVGAVKANFFHALQNLRRLLEGSL